MIPQVAESSIDNQEQLASMIGISVDTLYRYKELTELIPELEDLVETGILAPTKYKRYISNLKTCYSSKIISKNQKAYLIICFYAFILKSNNLIALNRL